MANYKLDKEHFKTITGNIKVIELFDKGFLMKRQQEFTRRYLTGELYPSR